MNDDRIIRFARRRPSVRLVRSLERHLLNGGAAVLPTETQYALSAIATRKKSVATVRLIKGRSQHQPFSVFLPDRLALNDWGIELNDQAESLAEAFWPGPMTLILPTRKRLLWRLGTGSHTVAVRVSPEPLITQLCRRLGHPLVATSANPSGLMLSPREENLWLKRKVEAFAMIWARPALFRRHGPSTVLDCSGRCVRLVRDGAIPSRIWRQVLPSDSIETERLEARR